jgi:hypothetical protein
MQDFRRVLVWSADYRRTAAARYAGRLAAATGAALTLNVRAPYCSCMMALVVARAFSSPSTLGRGGDERRMCSTPSS